MRPWSAAALCAFTGTALAQIQAQTFYTIPPTNGCDGVWAVDGASLFSGCGGAMTYATSPDGCAQWMNMSFSGDTLLLPLCSLPCDFYVYCDNGTYVYCQVLPEVSNGLAATHSSASTMAVSDGLLSITSPVVLTRPLLRVIDAQGRPARQERMPDGDRWTIALAGLPSGEYTVTLDDTNGRVSRGHFVLVR